MNNSDIKRVIVLTDTHLVLKNPSNRLKMIEEGIDIINGISKVVKENNIDIVVHTGDLYDRGYPKVPQDLYIEQINSMKELSKLVNGHMYMCMGNHSYSYAENNPEFVITDISGDEKLMEIYKYKNSLKLSVPIWKAFPLLKVGVVNIHLVHFDPMKRYNIKDGNRYNIGIFHDDFVTFQSKEELYHHKYGKGIDVVNTDIFDSFNTAIIGHIHKPLMDFRLNNFRMTEMIIPGSLVNRTTAEKHEYVDLPIIEISESGKILDEEYNLPYKITKTRFYLPKFEDSFDLEKVEENKKMYEYAKTIKRSKIAGKDNELFEEFIKSLKNPLIEELIRTAEDIKTLKSEDFFKEFREYRRIKFENEKLLKQSLVKGY